MALNTGFRGKRRTMTGLQCQMWQRERCSRNCKNTLTTRTGGKRDLPGNDGFGTWMDYPLIPLDNFKIAPHGDCTFLPILWNFM